MVNTLTKALTGCKIGGSVPVALGHSCAVPLSFAQRQFVCRNVRRFRLVLLALACGLVLAGCAIPEAIPEAIPAESEQGDESATVEAIQTRVAETRAEQASAKEESMAAASEETQDQTTAVEETSPALTIAPTAAQQQLLDKLRPQGEAPELLNEVWLNSEPLKLADLRGKVVLVEFWTYG